MTNAIEHLLQGAALAGTLQLPGMMMANRVLSWRDDLAKLAPANRRIMVVIALTIVGVVQALGAICFFCAREIAAGGSGTGRGVVLLAFGLWSYRLAIQFVYAPVWPRHLEGRLSHLGLCILFALLSIAYGIVLVALLAGGGR
jgi:hypothetical protein